MLNRNSDSAAYNSLAILQPCLSKTEEWKPSTASQAKTDPKKPTLRDISNYRVRNTLGEGAVGTVKFVMHKARKEVYALKQVANTMVSIIIVLNLP